MKTFSRHLFTTMASWKVEMDVLAGDARPEGESVVSGVQSGAWRSATTSCGSPVTCTSSCNRVDEPSATTTRTGLAGCDVEDLRMRLGGRVTVIVCIDLSAAVNGQ